MRKSFTAILLMMSAVGLNAATYYKWTDSNGVPHYSQYAPTNGVDLKKIQVINTRELGSPAATSAAGSTGTASTPQTAEQKRIAELEAQNAQNKAQQQQQDKERCKSLQNSLSNLNVGGRVYEMDNKGERKYLDSREIELKRQNVAKAIAQYCK